MSNELAIIPKTFADVQTMAEVLAKSALMPDALRGKANDVVVQILAGAELGLSPMASIRGMHVISGKPTIAADTMVGIVLGSGLAEYFVQLESTATSVTFECKRKGAPAPQRCTWTMEDAKRAGLGGKGTWLQYPRQMLAARAKAELARSAFPDVCAGVYDPDELPSTAPAPRPTANGNAPAHIDASDAEIVSETKSAELTRDEALALITAAATLDDLKALAPSLVALRSSDAVKAAYKSRQRELAA